MIAEPKGKRGRLDPGHYDPVLSANQVCHFTACLKIAVLLDEGSMIVYIADYDLDPLSHFGLQLSALDFGGVPNGSYLPQTPIGDPL